MEHSVYISGIKKILKTRGLTYIDLAKFLKVSESGVKKMLNAKDISFRRVLQICDALDVLPGQLFSLSEKTSIPFVKITAVQEEALIQNRKLLAVYWLLTIERMTVGEIAKHQKILIPDVKNALQKLVSLNLVTQRKGMYTAKYSGKFRWPDSSKLATRLNEEWSVLTLKRALRKNENALHRLVATKLSNKSYNELLIKLTDVLDEYVRISEREELTMFKSDLQDFTALIAVAPGGVFKAIGE